MILGDMASGDMIYGGDFYESDSPSDTMAFAAGLAQKAQKGDIICLCGELGAGKTVFVKGFADGLGVKGYVNSPTFTLMQLYDDGRLPVYHFDLYRLEDAGYETLEEIGFFDCLDGDGSAAGAAGSDGVCLIEWAEYAREFIPDDALWVDIRRKEGGRKEDGSFEEGSFEEKRQIYVRGL